LSAELHPRDLPINAAAKAHIERERKHYAALHGAQMRPELWMMWESRWCWTEIARLNEQVAKWREECHAQQVALKTLLAAAEIPS
jgi:hypothetical protein